MSTLTLKRRRDIVRQKWQFIAVLVTVVLGVALFAGAFNAYLNLGASLDGSYDRLAMADLTVTDADDGFLEAAAQAAGVQVAVERRQADVPFEIGDYTFIGRVIGFPETGQPDVNRIDIDEGQGLDPDDPSGVIVEVHTADDFELELGDTFRIVDRDVVVRGIATSPEYLWPARDRQSTFTAPKSFGVVFANEALLASAADAVGPAVATQVLVLYEDDAVTEDTDETLSSAARGAGAADIQLLADQPSNVIIRTEMEGLRTMALALPFLFLAAAGMAIYVVVTRLVFAQRGVIGTLRATGFSARTMSSHYRAYGLTVGLAGAAIGAVLGGLLARGMTAIYTSVFGIPDLVAEFHLPTVVMALLFGAVAGVLAAVPPARTVARMPPAEAMRGDAPAEGGRQSIFETLIPPLRHAPVRWRMSLRGIGRNKKRSTSMVLGVVLGLILILASWGMMDTMLRAVDRQFNEVALEDASLVFSSPVGDAQIDEVQAVDGVGAAEGVISLAVTLVHEEATFGTPLEAYEAGTRVHGFSPPLPSSGVLLGQATEELLGVSVGDEVTVEVPDLETEFTAPVAGFVDEPLATLAYMEAGALIKALEQADPPVDTDVLALPTVATAKAVFDSDADSAAVLSNLKDVDDVAAVIDSSEIRDLIEEFQVFFYVFIGIMVLFGAAMAFALIFNIISVNVAERSGEFASMRANGLTHRRVASLIVGETILLTAIGVVPGLVAGHLAAVAFVRSFASEQFPIVADLRWFSYVGAAIAMFVVAGLSLVPALRAVRRIDVGEIVRERSA